MNNTLYALVDCNNFYASCERVFRPELARRPVVVLSNNDGCVIARSGEAKELGIPMGAPAYQWERFFRERGVAVFSSNYELYGDLSARVMRVLGQFAPSLEIYSIDEAFLELSGVRGVDGWARGLRERVLNWTGIPVSIGIGDTKTLAKVANRVAKKRPEAGGVFDLSNHPEPDAVLAATAVGDVWGIGRRSARKLARFGIRDALAFKRARREFVRQKMTVTGLHTLLELRGVPCLELESAPPPRKSVCCSRAFGRPVASLAELKEALALYVTRAAEKLRRERAVASVVQSFVATNRFKEGEPQYSNACSRTLAAGTAYTPALMDAAHGCLEAIYRSGYKYKKAGVIFSAIEPEAGRRLSLLEPEPEERARRERLMGVVDRINGEMGRDAVAFASGGIEKPWNMRRGLKSPAYTTSWGELAVVRVG